MPILSETHICDSSKFQLTFIYLFLKKNLLYIVTKVICLPSRLYCHFYKLNSSSNQVRSNISVLKPSSLFSIFYIHLQRLSVLPSTGSELQEELSACLRKLKRLPKPSPVNVQHQSMACIASWERLEPESGLEVTYK